MLTTDPEKLDGMRTYIDGKMRRYSLLFSVNGGAFAIAKLLADDSTAKLLGRLTVRHLAFGSIVFTIVMVVDIWLFARMIQREFLKKLVFGKPGKTILLLLGALLIGGWLLVAIG
ncbi:MAG TPA: hypothetical protein VJS64_14330 [Pyrinomonadaceae bacterium]|nr:hypothetical protein [Pyrinomonadaceae bacterium]